MTKKTIILYSSILLALLLGIGVAILVLYSGVRSSEDPSSKLSNRDVRLLSCVPTDALAIAQFSDFSDISKELSDSSSVLFSFSNIETSKKLVSILQDKNLGPSIISFHPVGNIEAMFISDFSKVLKNSEKKEEFISLVKKNELFMIDLGDDIWAISGSDVIAQSSKRHLDGDISVLDSKGFVDVAIRAIHEDRIFLSMSNIDKILPHIINRPYNKHSNFLKSVGEWVVLSLGEMNERGVFFSGDLSYESSNTDFVNVLNSSQGAKSQAAKMIPKYAVSFQSLMTVESDDYIKEYENFVDHNIGLGRIASKQKELAKKAKISPIIWAKELDIKEVATSVNVNLTEKSELLYIRLGKVNKEIVFKGTKVTDLKSYKREIEPFIYSDFVSSLFGNNFSVEDESFFVLLKNWIVVGSKKNLESYLKSDIYVNNLYSYMEDADLVSMVNNSSSIFLSYLNISEGNNYLNEVFKPELMKVYSKLAENYTYTPLVFSIIKGEEELSYNLDFKRLVIRQKFNKEDNISTPIIPNGAFKVKNSGTKKMNDFIQNADNSLSLKDENGKSLWTTKFSTPIAGRVAQIDYLKNGRIQFLFNSGSKLYLIDRLGRMVKPFPVNLGKEVILGPDVYDFNNRRTYNFFVLHQDNTIRMYNLQGKTPTQWKDIAPSETIINLPERIKVSGSTFWVVRTSVQTLIYSFYGGKSLVNFEGDKMIKPNSEIIPMADGSIQATSYDGRKVLIKLK